MKRVIRGIKYYRRVLGIRGMLSAAKAKITNTPVLRQMSRPEVKFPFFLRLPSSDILTFDQIIVRKEYEFDTSQKPGIIIDAGANIGLASIYFANKFPGAKIVSIEPEASNFEILSRNTAPYENIIPVRGALWYENTVLDLVDPGTGKWTFMTEARDPAGKRHGKVLHEVRGMTVNTIMQEHRIEHIDILKIDIEGAEREDFRDTSAWLGKVGALIIELHERTKPGCNRSFYNGSNGFDDEWLQGEFVYLARAGGCLRRTVR